MTMKIEAIIYSYKNKNLKRVVDALLNNTNSSISVTVFDQNPIDREQIFIDSRINYNYIVWDKIYSPSERKGDAINKATADYILELSDDCLLSKDWDLRAIELVNRNNCIVSGNSKLSIFNDNPYSITVVSEQSDLPQLNNYINKDFIFSSNEIWHSVQYPYFLKYHGEAELLSLGFFEAGYDIYSSPADTYVDLNLKTIDRLYVPYSKDHNYNMVIDRLNGAPAVPGLTTKRSVRDFLSFHGIDKISIRHLPYSTNDVEYDQYGLKFQDIDARKFISKTKSIY